MLSKPTIHFNGTSAQSLLENYTNVLEKVRELGLSMTKIYPHGRDYYPQGQLAILMAMDEWKNMNSTISGLESEMIEMVEYLLEH